MSLRLTIDVYSGRPNPVVPWSVLTKGVRGRRVFDLGRIEIMRRP